VSSGRSSLPTLQALPQGDDHLREDCTASRHAYQGRFLQIRQDDVRLPDGSTAFREYIVHPGAVMVVPLLDDGRLVMERQYRYPTHRAYLEFPAGKLDAGEPGIACGVRELFEETGFQAAEWAYAGELHNAIAYSDERIEIWFARGLVAGERQLDAGEFLDVFVATQDELSGWIADGTVTDAKTLIALLWLQQWRAGRWALTWKPASAWDDGR
jgi:ADP-ribose pyrophosphatase